MITASLFYIAILKNFKIRIYYHCLPENHSSALYYIKCSFLRYSSTRRHIFYSYQVLDSQKKEIPTNIMTFESIICQIPKEDYWGNPIGSNNYLTFQSSIIDQNGIKKNLLFNNKSHSKEIFENLSRYLQVLEKSKSHENVKIDYHMNKLKKQFISYYQYKQTE